MTRTWRLIPGREFCARYIKRREESAGGFGFTGAPSSTLARWFRRMFLPEDYPRSVSDDYLPFQCWDTAQGLCSYVRGSLTTRALLEGVGVGAANATAASAAAQFIARDICGMLGGLVFTLAKGRQLDAEAKQWRLFADLANNVGMAMELAAPLVDDGRYFLALACAGSIARSLCGCAAGATRAALTQHFARAQNAADIAAKEASQETAVTLIGMALGLAVTTITDGKPRWQWAVFLVLTVLHMYCNVRAVRSLVIGSLNRERVRLLLARFERNGINRVEEPLTPKDCAKEEALLPLMSPIGMNWMMWPWYRYRGVTERGGGIHLGAPLHSVPHADAFDPIHFEAVGHDLVPYSSIRKYVVFDPTEKKYWRSKVVLSVDATAETQLEAYVHAALMHCNLPRSNMQTDKPYEDHEADEWMVDNWFNSVTPKFIETIEGWGWNTKDHKLAADGWRVTWATTKDD